jgi:uncharacterized membrane protein YjjB (DUF3815 family)
MTIETIILTLAGAFLGTLGLSFLINTPRQIVMMSSATGMIGYLFYKYLETAGHGPLFCYFVSALVIALACEAEARIIKRPVTIFLLTALVPLVPGYSLYWSMLEMVRNETIHAAEDGVNAILAIAAIAIGAAVASILAKMVTTIRKRRRQLTPPGME